MAILTVSTAAQLRSALSSASGGDTILLASGNYGHLGLTPRDGIDVTFPANVTIASANPQSPAIITGLDLRGGENITFKDITFDYTFEGGPTHTRPFHVTGSENIAFRNCTFDGDVARGVSEAADGYGYGIGLSINTSSGVVVDGCEFFDFHRGAVFGRVTDLKVTNNDIHSLRMDGLNFGQVTNVLIEDNLIHNFKRSPIANDHADMIQFWTNGATYPSSNVVIRNNHLDIGAGSPSQSIFMRNDQVDRGLAGEEMFYRNILIENNVIVNSHAHGITVGETAGLIIRNNTVLHDDGAAADGSDPAVNIPRINVSDNATNVTITQNMTSDINGWKGQPGWTVGSNLLVQNQDPLGPGYYGDLFLASTLDLNADRLHEFQIIPGSLADQKTIGASATLEKSSAGLDVAFHVTQPASGDESTRIFDATFSTYNGKPLPAGTIYQWTFSDGTKMTGAVVNHTFSESGPQDATLTVRLPIGSIGTADADLVVQDKTLVEMTSDGRFLVSDDGFDTIIARQTLSGQAASTQTGLQLGGTGAVATVGHTYIDALFGVDEFRFSLSLDADTANAQGEVFRIHGSMITSVNSNGEFVVRLFSTDGTNTVLTSTGKRVNDQAEHDIDITLDNGTVSLWVDGKLASERSFDGQLRDYGGRSLTFGNAWGRQNFDGDLTAFEISLEADQGASGFTQTADDPSDVMAQVSSIAAFIPAV